MELLENTHKRHPADRDTLLALVSIARDTGDFAAALLHASLLRSIRRTCSFACWSWTSKNAKRIKVFPAHADPKDLSALA